MENNDNDMRSIHEYVEDTAEVQAPAEVVVEAPEPVAEPVEEPTPEPVVEAPVAEAVVQAPAAEEPVQALGFTKTGAIGSMAADGPSKQNKTELNLSDKVAIYSSKSVRWESVGAVSRGYNIVTKAQADKWLTRSHVRIATPEEVKKAFG
jgi:hypothetical protein